jgi:hypothetical protein
MTIPPAYWDDPASDPWVASHADEAACSVCGERPTAVWHGRQGKNIWICSACALHALPCLIADAIHDYRDAGRPTSPFEAAVPRFLGRYWYAVASRIGRRLRPQDQPPSLIGLNGKAKS